MPELPVMCTLGPAALRARREGLLKNLLTRAAEHHKTADGYRIRFAAGSEILPAVAGAVDAERECCRFLRFHITVEPDGGPVLLDLTGPAGTADFIAALLQS